MRNALLVVAIATLATGCGGGGSPSDGSGPSGPPPSSANTAPTITGLADGVSIAQDSSSEPVAFKVADAEASPQALSISIASSNPQLITPDSIELSGNDGERSLLLRPAEGVSGTAALTITATDAQGLAAQRTLNVTVTSTERSFHEMVETAYARQPDAAAENTTGYQWTDNSEDDDKSFDHLLDQ